MTNLHKSPKYRSSKFNTGLLTIMFFFLLSCSSPRELSPIYEQGKKSERVIKVMRNKQKVPTASKITVSTKLGIRESFITQKNKLLMDCLNRNLVSRVDQLSTQEKKGLHQAISSLFIEEILQKIKIEAHVYNYFTNTTDLHKLETALMEQCNYHVPASIILAQSVVETGYGRRIVDNNYFGIKDKSGNNKLSTTTEYYTPRELKLNKSKVLSKKKVFKGGKQLWKCVIKDHFEVYQTPWESFRAHSKYLVSNPRYHALFTEGKDYRAWADKIGSTKYGGVGYATSPSYGKLLKQVIQRYNLDLLDF